jgi:hypothetical protein
VAAHLHLLTRPPVPGSPAAAQRPATRQSVPSPLVTCARPMPSSSAFQGGRLAGAASAILPWVTRPLVGQVTSVSQTHALASTQRAQQASVHEQTGRGGAGAPLRTPAARRARACRAAAHSSAHLAGRLAQPTQSHTVARHHKRTPTTWYGTETPDLGAPETDGRLHAPPSHACLTSGRATVPAAGGWRTGAHQGRGWHASLFCMQPHPPALPAAPPMHPVPHSPHSPMHQLPSMPAD